MSGRAAKRRKTALVRQMQALAAARVNDAVKLAYLSQEEMDQIDGLDLTALVEFKRSGNGAVEVKFSDRIRAMQELVKLEQDGAEQTLVDLLTGEE